MLRFVENLRLNSSQTATELSEISAKIYSQYFAELIKNQSAAINEQKSLELLQNFDAQKTNLAKCIEPTENDVWIFGYGSLVWKADFPYIDRRRGFISGYKRRFYQHSIDHRGIPEKPGRVVTLLPGDIDTDRVYGVAYRIAAELMSKVLDHLDYREKNGYDRVNLEFHEYPVPTIPIKVIMYMASQANDSYAGDVWQVECIARQIFTSAGPSGPNREYLFNLSIAMHKLFPNVIDEHLTELVACLQRYIDNEEPTLLERALTAQIESVLNECIGFESTLQSAEIAQRLEALRQRLELPGWREKCLHQQLDSS